MSSLLKFKGTMNWAHFGARKGVRRSVSLTLGLNIRMCQFPCAFVIFPLHGLTGTPASCPGGSCSRPAYKGNVSTCGAATGRNPILRPRWYSPHLYDCFDCAASTSYFVLDSLQCDDPHLLASLPLMIMRCERTAKGLIANDSSFRRYKLRPPSTITSNSP